MTPSPRSPDRLDPRRWYVLGAVALAIFLGTIDGSIVNVALPTFVDEFETTFAAVQWIVLAYLLTQATLVLGIGRLGDIIGKKRIFTTGFAVFTVGSVLAGLSPSIGWLIAARVVQGVGSAMIFALGFAIVADAFDARERGRALGINGTAVSAGIITGPIVGGLILEAVDWRWIFFVNLPIGILGILAAIRFVPRDHPEGGQRFDFAGAAAFFVTTAAFLSSLTIGQDLGFGHPAVVGGFLAAAVGLIVFVSIERTVDDPMLDLALFKIRTVTAGLVAGFTVFVSISGLLLILPFYLTDALGYGPRDVGLLLAAIPASLGIVSPIAGALSDRLGTRPVRAAGLAILLTGLAAAFVTLTTGTSVTTFIATGLVIGVGIGVFQSPNNAAVLGESPRERLGVVSGALTVTRLSGSMTGVAVLGTVWAAVTTRAAGGTPAASAPPEALVTGLHAAVAVAAILVAIGLATVVTAWHRDVGAGTVAVSTGSPGVRPPGRGTDRRRPRS